MPESPYVWLLCFAVAGAALFPVDAELLPHWLHWRTQLFVINLRLRLTAFWLWLKLPKPRPKFKFIPVQDRNPLS